jgi:hypothetical protein
MALLEKPDRDTLYQLYIEEGMSQRRIAKVFSCSQGTILHLLRSYNIPVRLSCSAPGKKYNGRHNANGYVRVYQPNHPRANWSGYVLEHIAVWERHNGPIPKGWHVHHKNGVKDDNRIENLEAMPQAKHAQIIPKMQRRIKYLEALLTHHGIPFEED